MSVLLREAIPPIWLVAKPCSERIAGPELLHPRIEMGSFLGDPARPQPIHQNAYPVACSCRLVGSLQSDG
jgi:hypothetical protein